MPGDEQVVDQEVEAPEAGAEVVLHQSMTDILSHDPSADALGGLNVGLEDGNLAVDQNDKDPEAADLAEKGETDKAEPPPAEKEPEVTDWEKQAKAFQAKALDEVSKRQALEQSISAAPPVEKADLFEDPDTRLKQELDPMEQRFNNRLIAMSEAQAKGRHEDFDEKYGAFAAAAQTDPGLVAKAIGSVDPGEFVYQEGKKQMLTKELGDGGLESIRDKIRAEERAKLKDEINQGVKTKLDEIGKLPPSAGDFTGKNSAQKPVDTDLSLTQILDGR